MRRLVALVPQTAPPSVGAWAAWGQTNYTSHRVARVDGLDVETVCGLRVGSEALAVVTVGPGAVACSACSGRGRAA